MLVSMLILAWVWFSRRFDIRLAEFSLATTSLALIVMAFGLPCHWASAEDPYHREVLFDRRGRGESDRAMTKAGLAQKHLREGTRIPPTVGQIVMMGRRWAFVPASVAANASDDVVELLPHGPRARNVGFRSPARPTRIGFATPPSATPQPSATTLAAKDAIFDRQRNAEIPHIILIENLMLQRIVEAIRADANDDQWMISGEVTEFFNENRLTIRTAQRDNAN